MKSISCVLLLLTSFVQASLGIKITELNVPATVNADLVDHVILDCVYEVDKSLIYQLDIKWYFDNSPYPFYLWLPGYKPRVYPIDPFQGSLDLSSSHLDAKEINKLNEHRAIKILHPDHTHSGVYTCKAATFIGEDAATASMIVYGLPERRYINVYANPGNPRFLNVECQFLRVFPKPKVALEWASSSNMSGSISGGMSGFIFPNEKVDYAFDVEIFYEVEIEEVEEDVDVSFDCSLEIPEVDQKVLLNYEFQIKMEKEVIEEIEEEVKGEIQEEIYEERFEVESGSGTYVDLSEESGEDGAYDSGSGFSGDEDLCGSGLYETEFSGEDNLSGSGSFEIEFSGEEDISGSGSFEIEFSDEEDISGSGSYEIVFSGEDDLSGSGSYEIVFSDEDDLSGSGSYEIEFSGEGESGSACFSGEGSSCLEELGESSSGLISGDQSSGWEGSTEDGVSGSINIDISEDIFDEDVLENSMQDVELLREDKALSLENVTSKEEVEEELEAKETYPNFFIEDDTNLPQQLGPSVSSATGNFPAPPLACLSLLYIILLMRPIFSI